jgi:hypothetical protein
MRWQRMMMLLGLVGLPVLTSGCHKGAGDVSTPSKQTAQVESSEEQTPTKGDTTASSPR